ncbi:MAG: Na+/H+ antiporter subunit E [Syntrophorhabdaceae bacterium]|nr:Na+/H+ antiporter subunit E [Syntrophorhabdaceae bacterium]
MTFFIFLGFWIFMSGLFDIWHFGLGVICCALVSYMSSDLFFKEKPSFKKAVEVVRFVKYIPWLLYQIGLANIYIVKLAFHPKMKRQIYPHVVRFKTVLKDELSLVTFANSITLTPGTITLLIDGDVFYVHAIDKVVADSLPGEMEKRVGHIFGEVLWKH